MSIFDGSKRFRVDRRIRLIELFGGIGSQAKALKNLGVDFEHYKLCEIDKFAVKSYNAIHDTKFITSDITMLNGKDLSILDTEIYLYVMTYSFPCTDLSSAGLRMGMAEGGNTHSGLLWEVKRLLTEAHNLPQVLLMENVPEVIGKKNIRDFAKWFAFLERLGYRNYYRLLNARNFGIPQNRLRCFMVSVLGDYYYTFPEKLKQKVRLKDFLQKTVDESYYLSQSQVEYYCRRREKYGQSFAFRPRTVEQNAVTITTKSGSRPMDNYIIESGNIQFFLNQPKILDRNTAYGYYIGCREDFDHLPLKDLARTLTAQRQNNGVVFDGRIRKLTPLECFRLMGFSDDDFFKCQSVGISKTQLFKQAGNSIVVNVLEAIFKMMIKE